ncbi:MAG TPA: hypothetical protein ENG87_00460 [Candidatus Pacearchaeota archaeon]|nr:hypothetical protein [Candidatus Pacearchaeota archaeon]
MNKKIKRDRLGRFVKGEVSLRKGIKLSKEEIENLKRSKINMWKNKEHPRGMLGKKQSKKWKEEQSKKLKEQYESRKRVSNFKGNSYWKGKHKSKQVREKNRLSHLGQIPWNKGLKGEDNPLFGREYSEEHKKNLSLGRKGKGLGNIPWNKDLVGVQKSDKKGKTFEELYGKEKSRKLKENLKERRSKQIFPIKDTSIEVKIQNFLKQLNIEFFTHQYMKIEHGYQCDILIPIQEGISKKTIIECFGNYWHKYPLGRKIDIQRCSELREKGWRVLTFWESEIKPMQLNNLQEKLIC